jgi:hypothetical protein
MRTHRLLLGLDQGGGDALQPAGDGERGVVAGGALHDDGDQLGVLARVVGAERPVDLLAARAATC